MKTTKLLIISILSFSLSNIRIYAQENISLKNDIFSGVNGQIYNPTHFLYNPNKWDTNLIGGDISFNNNYEYISQQSVLGALKNNPQGFSLKKNITGENSDNIQDFYPPNNYFYYGNLDILSPAVTIKFPIKNTIVSMGIFSRQRAISGEENINSNFYYHNFTSKGISNITELPKVKTSFANWNEIGINTAFVLKNTGEYQSYIGTNIKILLGFDGGIIDSKNTIYINKLRDAINSINIADITANYDIDASFATAYDFENKKYSFKNQGQGLGLDLGFTYMKNRYHENSEREYLYDYKIDVSLLDFGKINFNGEVHNFKGNPIFLSSYKPFGKNNSPSEFMQSMSQKVYGDLTQSLQNQEFEIGLPTMLNISFSKSTSDNTYLTGGISQRVPIFKNSLKKANNIYINYGCYKDFIGLATSFSLYNYKIPQFGGYIRIGGLYLGSDNLLPLIIKQRKLHSFDFYFGLKLFPFWNNDAKRRWKSKCCD